MAALHPRRVWLPVPAAASLLKSCGCAETRRPVSQQIGGVGSAPRSDCEENGREFHRSGCETALVSLLLRPSSP